MNLGQWFWRRVCFERREVGHWFGATGGSQRQDRSRRFAVKRHALSSHAACLPAVLRESDVCPHTRTAALGLAALRTISTS
jgi:hypothetical protein